MAKKALAPGKDLTPRQLKAAALEANPDTWSMTQVEKAKQVGVAHTTLGRWQKIPEYCEYKTRLIREYAEKLLPKAWSCLSKRMETDTQALKLYFTLLGEYKQRHEITGEGGGPVRLAILAAYTDADAYFGACGHSFR